jgi:hypothetical protein
MSEITAARASLLRRGLLLEYFTVAWNVLEGIVAVAAGVLAASPALIGFGVDSAVESVSRRMVWTTRAWPGWSETTASRG